MGYNLMRTFLDILYLCEKRMHVYTVEHQWLEHLWDHENKFETGVVRANEGWL